MLAPKKAKYRKWQTGRKSAARHMLPDTRGLTVAFGSFGLKALTTARVTSNQLEAARRALSRAGGKSAKVWIRVFPDRPWTQKAAEVGMGSGKGDVQGVRICIAGRLGGAEMSRTEEIKKGRVPLQTLRADIDFAREIAYLPYGVIGVKVWIYRGEIFDKKEQK